VFENSVRRKTFEPKKEELAGDWRNLHNEGLHNLYCSTIIIRLIKSRRIWAGHVARMKKFRNAYKILVLKL
jgi:hypothetical protein